MNNQHADVTTAQEFALERMKKRNPEWVMDMMGRQFVKYEGLLDTAHQEGLCRISTTLIQVPHQDNGNVAIVHAEVETKKGAFSGIGDASPGNVGRMIVPHIIRMAETRAKARALRDAVNIGVTAVEEMSENDRDNHESSESRPTRQPEPQQEEPEPYRSDFPKASPYKLASANQLATIAKLSRLIGKPEEPREDMTSAEASERIQTLSLEHNEHIRQREPEHGGMVAQDGDFGTPPPNTHTGGDWKAATEQQAKMIYAISMDLKMDRSKIPARGVVEKEWSFEKASAWIDSLKAEQERRKADSGVTV